MVFCNNLGLVQREDERDEYQLYLAMGTNVEMIAKDYDGFVKWWLQVPL